MDCLSFPRLLRAVKPTAFLISRKRLAGFLSGSIRSFSIGDISGVCKSREYRDLNKGSIGGLRDGVGKYRTPYLMGRRGYSAGAGFPERTLIKKLKFWIHCATHFHRGVKVFPILICADCSYSVKIKA